MITICKTFTLHYTKGRSLKMTVLIEHRMYSKVVLLMFHGPPNIVSVSRKKILKVSICGGLWKMIYRE